MDLGVVGWKNQRHFHWFVVQYPMHHEAYGLEHCLNRRCEEYAEVV